MLTSARFGPSLLPVVVSAVTLIAFSGRPREEGGVSAHPRYRTVEEDSDLKLFVGVRVVASSPNALSPLSASATSACRSLRCVTAARSRRRISVRMDGASSRLPRTKRRAFGTAPLGKNFSS